MLCFILCCDLCGVVFYFGAVLPYKVITWGDNRTAQLSHDFHDDPDNRFSDRWITYTFQDTDEDAPVKEDMPMLPRCVFGV